MTGRQKVAELERQVLNNTAEEGLDCPFCNVHLAFGSLMICCARAARVIEATLNHAEFKEVEKTVNRILDRAGSALNN